MVVELDRFKPLYELHVSKDLDTISTILWKREPIPITVFNYYKALEIALDRNVEGMRQIHKGTDKKAGKISIDVVQEAKNLTARSNFYEHQFLLMRTDSSRQQDIDFLCTLKICYQLGIDRTIEIRSIA